MTSPPLPIADLDHVLEHTRAVWEEARGARLFLTGATGFFGTWLVESFLHANARLNLDASLVLLTRDPDVARRRSGCFRNQSAISLVGGDVRDFAIPNGTFDFVVHAATESSRQVHAGDERHMADTIVGGTRRVLAFARQTGVRRFLLVSSGAVYGRQPPDLERVSEDYTGGPDLWDPHSAYAEGKRLAEVLCAIEEDARMSLRSARCFAFVGPHLPLDAHFAIGNFIGDALAGRPILIRGDGSAVRSYLYMADLAIWLWTLALSPVAVGPYNVGSQRALSVLEVARTVSSICAPGASIEIGAQSPPGAMPHRYVPSTARAAEQLSLREWVDLEDAISRTSAWLRQPLTQPSS